MTIAELIVSIIAIIFAVIMALISVRSFREKGFLFNNAYIWASKTERERLYKKPYYRQSAIVFCLLSVVFLVIGISIILQNYKIQLLEIPLMVSTLIFAVISSARIEKYMKK